ncbi:acetyl-CoA carboxylase biotin carboxyl carrier protein [Clostridium novyi]|uniref:acetyl-CoA carboxylase biotin carboxyl carrier protein n=1 Tax=Clostridium novyi TaxID=1542 RepID=UPI00068D0CF4|nr:acetyl-CoA carboxylase biotin carboxyl carrier protein [Clostridium novyi]
MRVLNYKEICEIIKTVSDSNLTVVEIKDKDIFMKMSKGITIADDYNILENELNKKNKYNDKLEVAKDKVNNIENTKEKCEENYDEEYEIISSPLVGTFYKSPSPDSEPYVSVGSKVLENDVLCIVEAMKLMNEIESTVSGEVIEILVQDGEMVEYNQPLFKIKR